MKPVLVTQRVEIVPGYGERRDALDQMWASLLSACGLLAVPVPNVPAAALGLADAVAPAGLVLTGGNDLGAYGGNAPERDRTEEALIEWCRTRRLPVFGVCRGLQVLAHLFGADLVRLEGHAGKRHAVDGRLGALDVNSFHDWGPRKLPPGDLVVDCVSPDGVVEGFHHRSEAIAAIMWHPEREAPFRRADIDRLSRFFGGEASGMEE